MKNMSVENISKVLRQMRNKRCTGYDGATSEFFETLPSNFQKTLMQRLISECLKNQWFLESLKIEDSIPSFEKGNDNQRGTYRPISVSSSYSNISETVIHHQKDKNVYKNFLLYPHQFGVETKRSCINAICEARDKNMRNSPVTQFSLVFIEVMEAFHTLEHKFPLEKVERCIFRELFCNLIFDCFNYRCSLSPASDMALPKKSSGELILNIRYLGLSCFSYLIFSFQQASPVVE